MERSLVLLKPDAVQRALIGRIIQRFEDAGLKISAMKMVYSNEKLAGEHYADDEEWKILVGKKQRVSYDKKGLKLDKTDIELGAQIRGFLIHYLTMGPIIALVVEGHNVIDHIRKLVGTTSPQDSAPGTIRGDLAFDTYQLADTSKRPIQNLIHASGNVGDAEREIPIWFTDKEIHSWKRVDEDLIYRIGKQ